MIHVFGAERVHYAPPKELLEKPYNDYQRTVKSEVYGGSDFKTPSKEKRLVEYQTQTDVLFFNSLSESERLVHTQKPVDLLEFLVETYSCEGDVVLDSTMGSASLALACRKLNRGFIGIEKNAQHYILAHKRVFGGEQETLDADERLQSFVNDNYDALLLAYQNNISFTALTKIIFETEGYFCKWICLRDVFTSFANDRGDIAHVGKRKGGISP